MISNRLIYTALAAPLALALAACGSNGAEAGGVAEGEPVAEVAAPDGQQWSEVVTVTDYDGYMLGNPDAPIKVVEYASLTCPTCAAFVANGVEQLKEKYVDTGRVSFELRNQIHGPHDLVLARLVRCGPKETFHPRSDMVWRNQSELLQAVQQNGEAFGQALTLPEDQRFVQAAATAGFYDFFSRLGLSTAEAQSCLADFASMEAIARNSNDQSAELGIQGTPTFIVNGQQVDANNWTDLEPFLQRAGAR